MTLETPTSTPTPTEPASTPAPASETNAEAVVPPGEEPVKPLIIKKVDGDTIKRIMAKINEKLK